MRLRYDRTDKGFTLIELMIVVAIVAILASIAIPEFLNFQLRSRRAEAFVNLKGMATAQMAHYHLHQDSSSSGWTPNGAFVSCSVSPTTPLDRAAYPFDATIAGWQELGWAPDGDVRCHYAARVFSPGAASGAPRYWVRNQATCDMDNDGRIATWRMDVDPEDASSAAQHMVLRANSSTASQNRF